MTTVPLNELDLDGHVDGKGIRYIGKAIRQEDDTWRCLADVGGALCTVEVSIVPEVVSSEPNKELKMPTDKTVIGWSVYEIVAGSPEALENDKNLQISRWTETDEADRYRSKAAVYRVPPERGSTSIPVLSFLNGRPWNNAALNVVHGLRPSSIRVSIGGGGHTNVLTGRVTVSLKDDDRTINHITQEVWVGLIGCRYGADVSSYIEGRTPQTGSGVMSNPRGIEKTQPHDPEKKRCIQTRPKGQSSWLTCKSWEDVESTLQGWEFPVWEFRLAYMTDSEVEALGEFDGW